MYKILILLPLLCLGCENISTETETSEGGYQCGQKSRCYEMDSCTEVKWYFKNCNLPDLDRDNDGVPCESLCE
jgi:hypothetical protein